MKEVKARDKDKEKSKTQGEQLVIFFFNFIVHGMSLIQSRYTSSIESW